MKQVLIFLLLFSGYCCQGQGKKSATKTPPFTGAKIAYVNIDSLEAKYVLLIAKRAEFKARKEEMESELLHTYEQMQQEADDLQKKVQAKTLSEPDFQAAQKRLDQKQQDLETRKQVLTDQFTQLQEEVNADMKMRLDAFLEEYNKTRHYDCILSYSNTGSAVLYINKQLDITREVIEGMNAHANVGNK